MNTEKNNMAIRKKVRGSDAAFYADDPTPSAAPIVANDTFMERVLAFDRWMPDRHSRPSQSTVESVYSEGRAILDELRVLLQRSGAKDRSGKRSVDFSLPSYAGFLEREKKTEAAFAMFPAGLLAMESGAFPNLILADVSSGTPLRRGGGGEEGQQESGTRRWIAKLFAALGVGEAYTAILEILEADGILRLIARAIQERDWDSLKRFLKMLFRTIASKGFLRKLAEKIGQNAAARIIGSILGKCLPIVGWLVLIGSIIWAIAEQFV